MREARVESNARDDNAETVRPDHAQQMRPCRLENGVLQLGAVSVRRLAEAGGDDDRRFGAAAARFGPRLTGSSAADDAGMWARDQMNDWGLSNWHISQ